MFLPISEDPALPDDDRGKALEKAIARHHHSADSLIEILHVAQQLYGYLSRSLLARIARALSMPPSRVLGVATFYHLFRFAPRKRHSAVVCLGTACYAAGGTDLMSVMHRCTRASEWTIDAGRCVGSCGLAPIVICEGEAMARVTPTELEACLRRQA